MFNSKQNNGLGQGSKTHLQDSKLPRIPELKNLPSFLEKVIANSQDSQEKDILMLTTIGVIGGLLDNVQGVYDKIIVHPTICLFFVGGPSTGKGRMNLAGRLVTPFQADLDREYEVKLADYKSKKEEADKEKRKNGGKTISIPDEPEYKQWILPGDSSDSALIRQLKRNNGSGIILESEADRITSALSKEYGDFSSIIRCFEQHEDIKQNRVKNDRPIVINKPKVSIIVTGTPNQIRPLVKQRENGLMSRFSYYTLQRKNVFKDVSGSGINLNTYFDSLGKVLYLQIRKVRELKIHFNLTDPQWKQLQNTFQKIKDSIPPSVEESYDAVINRLGLTLYRIAMIFSVMRQAEEGKVSENIICSDIDFHNAMVIVGIIEKHSFHVFTKILATPMEVNELFFHELPASFKTSLAYQIGKQFKIPERTVDYLLNSWTKTGSLEKPKTGNYIKPKGVSF